MGDHELLVDGAVLLNFPVDVLRDIHRGPIIGVVVARRDGIDIEDRTFSLSVDGGDIPTWITREGFLKVGDGNAYFVLDNAYVEFQLEADDTDLNAGDVLEYYVQVWDNKSYAGYQSAKTAIQTLKLPSDKPSYENLQEVAEDTQNSLENLLEQNEQTQELFEDLKQELRQNQDANNWENKQQVERIENRKREVENRLENVREQFENMQNRMEEEANFNERAPVVQA